MSGYDIGLSVATASGAEGGRASTGPINIGGSGGVNQMPWYVWAGLAFVGLILFFKVLFPSKR